MKSNIKKIYTVAIILLVVLIAAVLLYGNKKNKSIASISRSAYMMDTIIAISLYGEDAKKEEVLSSAIKLCEDYDNMLSIDNEDSEIYKLNHRPAGENKIKTTKEAAELISKALSYCDMSKGSFDITIEPVSSLWDFNSDSPKLPDSASLNAALNAVDYHNVSADGEYIIFANDDTRIDIGAIGKGYIADKVAVYLKEQGIKSAIINLGGNVLCIGKYDKNQNFKIGLMKPYSNSSEVIETLSIENMSVVSSGVYERCFDLDGVHYHHILNPSTGYPYQNGLTQVTIVTESSTAADALSTVVFCLGEEEGTKLIEGLDDTYAFFVHEDGSLTYTNGAEVLIDGEH